MRLFLFILALFFLNSCQIDSKDDKAASLSTSPLSTQKGKTAQRQDGVPSPYTHPWNETSSLRTIQNEIPVPPGAKRLETSKGLFGHWLQNLPLKKAGHYPLLFNGSKKGNDEAHYRVIDIDVGEHNLQQCADAVLRLRAEFLWNRNRKEEIAFSFTSGDVSNWSAWSAGKRPIINGNNVSWKKSQNASSSYANFRAYLDNLFTYAGTLSIDREHKNVLLGKPEIGDFFVQGGSPGHAMIIVDLAEKESGELYYLLAQSYMPAQEMHVVRNPRNSSLSPWYKWDRSRSIQTPEWEFQPKDLHRFEL